MMVPPVASASEVHPSPWYSHKVWVEKVRDIASASFSVFGNIKIVHGAV